MSCGQTERLVSSVGATVVFAIYDGEDDTPIHITAVAAYEAGLQFMGGSIARLNSRRTHQSDRYPLSFRAPPPSSLPRFALQ